MPATATASSSAASGSSTSSSGPAKLPKKPKSVKPFQLTQLQRTLNRRRQHLDRLSEEELQTVLDLVIETLYGGDGGGKNPAAGSNGSTSGGGGRLAEVIESLPYANDELRNSSRDDTAAAVVSKLKYYETDFGSSAFQIWSKNCASLKFVLSTKPTYFAIKHATNYSCV